ncbi:MAG: UDP-N-acetylmuramate--L-alanine ligase [Persicimonas sp.]
MLDFSKDKPIHLLGIGGVGVSGVARVLHQRGFNVRGSDVRQSSITEALVDEGMEVVIGHEASNIEGAQAVVVSTAIPDHNVELKAAKERGMPVVHRSEVLGALIADYRTVGVTGTHGKGTVSSMIAWILECAGWEPGFVIGAMLNNFATNARDAGDSKWMVVEIDESDGSHLNIRPDYVVCNFLELDHLNYYDGLDDIIDNMIDFMESNERLKEAFVNLDCDGNRNLCERVGLRPTGYAVEHRAEFRGELLGPGQLPIEFEGVHRNESLGRFELNLPGRYNVVNAMGAMAVCRRIGVEVEAIREGLKTYAGMENRFTIASGGGVTIVKDYISHPTGMRKVLQSAQDLTEGRIFSVFKPYRYTLIKYLQDEYGAAFQGSDEVIITKMYAADEDPIPGIDTHTVVDRIRENDIDCTYIEDQYDINGYLLERVEPGDKVIFFGGDDFFRMADEFLAEVTRRAQKPGPGPEQPKVSSPFADSTDGEA